jgi:hypothetical protein
MPFLPFVLLLAWQAISKSASFALGWATAIYFGQVPGKQGRILSVICLVAAAWVIVLVGFAVPLLAGALLDATGAIRRNFTVDPLVALALSVGVVATPPAIAGATVWAEFHDERSVRYWLSLVAGSYPASASLGISVIQMVLFTPVLLVQRLIRKQALVQTALSMREGTDDDDLLQALRASLRTIGLDKVEVREVEGIVSWPMRTVGFAARHLIGAVVRGDPVRLDVDGLQVYGYATNVAIMGPPDDAHRARAALQRELPFNKAHVTWSESARDLEDELLDAMRSDGEGGRDGIERRLEQIRGRMDRADLDPIEWGALDRIRMQVLLRSGDQRAKVRMAKPRTRISATNTTSTRAFQFERRSG